MTPCPACRDIGTHIDGFTSVQAQTVVVQPAQGPVTGRPADAIQAARTAFDAALRLMRPGHKISEVARHLNKIVETYGCQLVEGVMSHEMKQFVIDGNKCVLNRPSPEQKVEDGEFEENEVGGECLNTVQRTYVAVHAQLNPLLCPSMPAHAVSQ